MLDATSSIPPEHASRSYSPSSILGDLSSAETALARARDRAIQGGRHELATRLAALGAMVDEVGEDVASCRG